MLFGKSQIILSDFSCFCWFVRGCVGVSKDGVNRVFRNVHCIKQPGESVECNGLSYSDGFVVLETQLVVVDYIFSGEVNQACK